MNHGPQKLLLSAMALVSLLFAESDALADYPPHWSFYQTVPAAGYAPVQPVVAPAATYGAPAYSQVAPAAYGAPVAGYPANACCAPQPVCCQRPVAPVYPLYPQVQAQYAPAAPVYAQPTTLYRPGVIGYQQTVAGYAPATVVGAPRRYGLFRPPAYLRPVQATSYYAPAYGY